MLGLAASMPTLAVDFVSNDTAPSVISPPPGSESSLQTIVTTLFPSSGINVNTDQSSTAFWSSSSPSAASSIPTLVAEFCRQCPEPIVRHLVRHEQRQRHQLRPAARRRRRDRCGRHDDRRQHAQRVRPRRCLRREVQLRHLHQRADQPNGGPRSDRFIAFQDGSTTNWLFAYEDGSDWDYNDMAIKVESITAVPEPETYALLMAGLAAVGFMSRCRKHLA